jgi:hypothetical protein
MSLNHQKVSVLNQQVKPKGCQHRQIKRVYTDDLTGTTEKQYCLDCSEFVESKYHSGKKAKDFDGNTSVWRHHL